MSRHYSNLSGNGAGPSKSIPFLSTAEMEHLNAPPPRASSLRSKLNSMHNKSARRYDKPTKPVKDRRVSLSQNYSQKNRRIHVGEAGTGRTMPQDAHKTMLSTVTEDGSKEAQSPETRAKMQLHAQHNTPPMLQKATQKASYNSPSKKSTNLLTRQNMELHQEEADEEPQMKDATRSPAAALPSRSGTGMPHHSKTASAAVLDTAKKGRQRSSDAAGASNGGNSTTATEEAPSIQEGYDLDLNGIPEYGSEDNLDWGEDTDYESDSDQRELFDEGGARALLAPTPQSPHSPLETTNKSVFFEEFRKLSRRNEIQASTMSADYLSSVIACGLPPEPLHVGRGKELDTISHRFRAKDLDGERLASLDAQFDLRGLQMGDGYVNGVASSLKHGGSGTCSLLLGNNRISPRGASSLLDQLSTSKFSTVLHLDLSENNIGLKGVMALVEGVTKPPGTPGALHLRHLDISNNNLNDSQLSTLINGLAQATLYNRTLRTFVADHNVGSRQTCIALDHFLGRDHKLKHLSMAWNRIGSQGGCPMLASGLLENSTLKVLNLAWNALGSSNAFAMLGEAISRHATLEHVDLSNNRIRSADIVTFSNDMDKNHNILGIHLAGNVANVNSLGFITAGEDPPTLSSSLLESGRKKKKTTTTNTHTHTTHKNKNKNKHTKRKNQKKWKNKKNKSHKKTVIQQVLHALFMLWMESGIKPTEIFSKMDTDNDGTLTAREFRDGLQTLGLNISGGDASIVFMEMDANNSGGLAYKELLGGIKKAGRHPPPISSGRNSSASNPATDPFHSQVETGKLTSLDHVHSSHIKKDPRGGGKGYGDGGGGGIMSELGLAAIHSCCWVCSGYKEEVFVYNIPRGSPDEALEEIAICFDFEQFTPRGTEKLDTRTAATGGVQFVARRVVPPGELRYYFLVDGVAHHNPDEPSTPLDIKSMIKKKRPITSTGASWSKVASKYTKRPRCNTRNVSFRTGYLVTRSLPRPTGMSWDDVNDLEGDEPEAEPTESESTDIVLPETESMETKTKDQVRVISQGKTAEIIAHIWEKKARYDNVQRSKKRQPLSLFDYSDQYFRTEFGVELGNKRMVAFEIGVKANWQKSSRIRWFATLIGWAPLRIDADFDTPPDVDAALAYSSVLMTCLPMDTIEERMIALPCMVDFDVLTELLDGNDGYELLEGKKKKIQMPPVLDPHFLATSSYQMVINELRQHVEKTFQATLIDLDEAMHIIMTTWYRWKYAPETMPVEDEGIEEEAPVAKVSIDVKNMLSSTRSFFDCRHSVSWNETQMIQAQQASFEADWLRCCHGPVETLMSAATPKEQERMKTMFRRHYTKLNHIFSLYAAADGGPFELGKYGAQQLFADLNMVVAPEKEAETAEPAAAAAAAEKQKGIKTGSLVGAMQDYSGLNSDSEEEEEGSTGIQAPQVVLSATTSIGEFQHVWNTYIALCQLMPGEGIRRYHFLGFLVVFSQQRYRLQFSPAISLTYMLTWEMCRGQIDYNPRRFRTAILYTPAITTVLSLHGHDLQTLFVKRATSISFQEFRLDTGSAYLTFEQFRDLLRSRGLTDFAGVSEPHIRLAFIASQDTFVDEAHTHPPGLLLDEMCEAIVRIGYSMLLTAEERVVRNKSRLKRVGKLGRKKKTARQKRFHLKKESGVEEEEVHHEIQISMARIVSALKSVINILMGTVKASDDPNYVTKKGGL